MEVLDKPDSAAALRDSINVVTGQLAEFDRIGAGLAAIEKAHPKNLACDVATTAGMKQAIAGRAAWRDPRIALEKVRKAAKAPVLTLGRDIDAFAKVLEARLLEGESNYDDQIKAEDRRREVEKAAREQAEREAAAAIQARIDAIRSVAILPVGLKAEGVAQAVAHLEAISTTLDEYGDRAGEAAQAKAQTLAKLDELHKAALAHEQEQARLIAEREELARLRAEKDIEDALIASIQNEAERIEADRTPYIQKAITTFESVAGDWESDPRPRVAAAIATAREQMQAKLRAAQERDRIAAEQKAEADRLAAERAAFEKEQAAARAEAKAREGADRARRDEEDRLAREVRAAEDQRIARERAELEAQQRAVREAEEAAERKRLDEEADKQREQCQMEAQEIQGIRHQAMIAITGRAPYFKGNNAADCLEIIAQTEKWEINAERFTILFQEAVTAKTETLAQLRNLHADFVKRDALLIQEGKQAAQAKAEHEAQMKATADLKRLHDAAPSMRDLLIESQTSIADDWRQRRDAVLAKLSFEV